MAGFQQQLRRLWQSLGHWRPQPLPAAQPVRPADQLARFILDPDKISRHNGRAKPRAFAPDSKGRLSLGLIAGLSESAIWDMGRKALRDEPGRRELHGRADLEASHYLRHGLHLHQNNIGFTGHVECTGWPMAEKDQVKEITVALSTAAATRVCTPPIRL